MDISSIIIIVLLLLLFLLFVITSYFTLIARRKMAADYPFPMIHSNINPFRIFWDESPEAYYSSPTTHSNVDRVPTFWDRFSPNSVKPSTTWGAPQPPHYTFPSPSGLNRDLLQGSYPERHSTFNPNAGVIGFGRPRPKPKLFAVEDVEEIKRENARLAKPRFSKFRRLFLPTEPAQPTDEENLQPDRLSEF